MNREAIALQIERYLRDPIVGDGVLAPPYKGQVSQNIRSALQMIGFRIGSGTHYDEQLKAAILDFQKSYNHRNHDGLFGPGTRRLLATVLADKTGTHALSVLKDVENITPTAIFLSYAWTDSSPVDKIDQWLRDNGVRVQRDARDFKPGQQIPDAIRDAIVQADKVLLVYSANSKDRDWQRFEISVAEQKEQAGGHQGFIIYLVLDNTPLPKHDSNRIAVRSPGKSVRQIGEELLRGIVGQKGEPPRIEFDENEPL
jgi:hypothetical protein